MSGKQNDILDQVRAWRRSGKEVALATVVRTWGSSPRPAGSHLAADAAGAFVGSVSGGCIEGAVIQAAQAVMADGRPRLLEFGVSDERAWDVGLACGGRIQVYVERIVPGLFDRVLAAAGARRPAALVTRLADGCQALVEADSAAGELELAAAAREEIRRRLRTGSSAVLEADETLFVRVYAPPTRLIIVGAVHVSQVLAPMAALAGYAVTIVDPRRAFATPERFPGVELVVEWPDEALARLAPDGSTALVTLTHDPKLDDPALQVALQSPAFYIGALGSRRTHARRVERLAELGLGPLAGRIHAPVGLDLGGRTPEELAVSVLAEVVRVRCLGETA